MASSQRTSAPPAPDADLVAPPDPMRGYPGSKFAISPRIIRQMPPHAVYVEGCAGRAATFRRKRPADQSILIDCDAKLCHQLRSYIARHGEVGRADVLHGDCLDLLPTLPAVKASGTLVYLDPPYLRSTRSRKLLYDFDSSSPEFHAALLKMAQGLGCMVMISGYASDLYAKALKRWRCVQIPAMTHGGPRMEHLWCNFEEPTVLHDPNWAGDGYRERERIKKKQKRWQEHFLRMDPRERQAIAAALYNVDPAAMQSVVRTSPPTAAVVDGEATM